jgi:hypothetical protein
MMGGKQWKRLMLLLRLLLLTSMLIRPLLI